MSKTERRNPDKLISTTRLTLAIGFGTLLAIMSFAGVDALRAAKQIQKENERIRRHFLFQNHVLNDIRADLYLSGTHVRDYLLEPDAARAEAFRANLEGVRKDMDAAVASYAAQAAPDEKKEYAILTDQLSRYWEIIG